MVGVVRTFPEPGKVPVRGSGNAVYRAPRKYLALAFRGATKPVDITHSKTVAKMRTPMATEL